MRLWSIHPQYLDTYGLNGLWHEGIITQNVLFAEGGGYYHHSALHRIKAHPDPLAFIGMYLNYVAEEANTVREYHYNEQLIKVLKPTLPMPVTRGQLYYEWCLLQHRLGIRSSEKMSLNDGIDVNTIKAHPMFYIVDGEIEEWERPKEKNEKGQYTK